MPRVRAEAAWFDHHTEYLEVAGQCGVGTLARRINTILGTHIRALLPALRRQVCARGRGGGGFSEGGSVRIWAVCSIARAGLLCFARLCVFKGCWRGPTAPAS
jgi:hypothetical protein